MKPYYEANGVTLYHGDCRAVLPLIDKNTVDLLLTDPPYGVNWQSNRRQDQFDRIAGDDSQDVANEGILLSLKALKRHHHLYLFGRYDLSQLPIGGHAELIWDKLDKSGGNLQLPWGSQHEYIQFAVYVPDRANRVQGFGNLAAKMRRGSILRYRRITGENLRHPTEKPVPLLRELIESSSCFDDVVLDPFAGSGATLVAAKIEGRRAIGVELDERYCEVAAGRLEQLVIPIAV